MGSTDMSEMTDMKRMLKQRADFEKETGPYLYTIELTSRSLQESMHTNWDEKLIVKQLRKIDCNVDAVLVAVNIRFKDAHKDKKMQSRLLTALVTLNDMLKELRMCGKTCCGGKYYNGSKIVKKRCDAILRKVGNVKSNFSMEVNVSGSANIGGRSNTIVDITSAGYYNENDNEEEFYEEDIVEDA